MTLKEFKRNYLRQYCLIEKDFTNTIDYVSISTANYPTYSSVYQKILLSIGSEIDVLKDCVCKLLDTDMKHLNQDVEPNFHSVSVEVRAEGIVLTPWEETAFQKWWTAYNEVKHNRNKSADKFDKAKKYYEYANLENVLCALAGLYSLELFAYKTVAEQNSESLFVPCIRSIFQVNNLYWKDTNNGSGYVVMNECLYMEDSI